ncbi:SusC/RagA family TonB-linked outer membrane protein [Bacteroides ovatus]|nr:SusC/RagA family TonB-linked outer membrane protein [Bacteroides ovatus]
MKRKLMLLLACLFVGIGLVTAQTQKVTGVVISEEDGQPVVGASVLVKGTTLGTITDVDGNFNLSNVPSSAKTLQISYIGMQTQEVAIKLNLRVVLKSDAQLIDEVVVTGYGVTKKAAFTGSAQTVDNKDLMKKTDANFMKSLEGSVAGLQVNSLTGQPGAYASTTIRGVGSMNSGTEPLYVIDGIAIYTDKMGAYNKAGTGDMAASPMANINPNDIESITVLKDATATAIYGARAANGVIVVTTKKGSLGKARFNVNAKVGTSFVGKIDHNYRTTNLDKYKEIWTEGLTNAGYDGEDGMTSAEWLNAYVMDWYNVDLTQNIKSVDWLKEILQNGFSQEYDISAQGGNENLRYYISGGYFQNTGIVIGTGMKRYSGRISLDGKSGRIGYGLSVNGALSDINNTMTESQYTNPIVAVYDIRPFEQVRNEDGTYNTNVNYNPVAINDKEKGDKRNQKQITLVVNPYFTYNIIDGLTWKTNAGLSLIDLDEFFYSSIYNPQYSGSGMLGQRNRGKSNNLDHYQYRKLQPHFQRHASFECVVGTRSTENIL